MGSVSNKNTITSIEGVLIETLENGKIQISTYDMNKGYRAFIDPVSVEREGRFIVNAQRLLQTVKVLPDDDITIEVKDNLSCEITCDDASFSMFALRGEDFPNLPELTTDRGFVIKAEILRKMIGKVAHSIAESDTRPMLCGAFFKISDGKIEVVSCDSYTLSRCSMECELSSLAFDGEINYSFIIPAHALGELSKILAEDDDEEVRVYLSRKHAIIKKEEVIFFTRTIDSEYIEYDRIIPKDNDIIVKVDRERLLSGLERANIIAEEKIQGSGKSYVKINFKEDRLILNSTSVNGVVNDEMRCVKEGGELEIGFNCRFLINSVRVAEGDNITLTFKSANSAMTIESTECEEGFYNFYMILPVRMNDSK